MNLLTYNYEKSISHGKKLLGLFKETGQEFFKISDSTVYIINMYLAEAMCMVGRFSDSYEYL